jgi:hypothetical protein
MLFEGRKRPSTGWKSPLLEGMPEKQHKLFFWHPFKQGRLL